MENTRKTHDYIITYVYTGEEVMKVGRMCEWNGRITVSKDRAKMET